jgi:predicted extracellular nuclease
MQIRGCMYQVTCDSLSRWKLYSKLQQETEFILEGSVTDSTYKESNYTGVLCKNSASVGKAYFFDSIQVEGGVYEKREEPVIEPIVYEKLQVGDLLINEVLFNSAENAEEFIEIYNNTDRTIDVSGLKITTKKTDGSLNAGAAIPNGTHMWPKSYLALCKNPSVDSLYYNCPSNSNFVSMKSWIALNNEKASILICNAAKDTIYDALLYSNKWHHPLIKNEQGVSLERINPSLPTQASDSWHSASSEVNYATPGYENSQYIAIEALETKKECWLRNESFTPNNDGIDDVLFVEYKLNETGWMANITIFDVGGQAIKSLYKSTLLSTQGLLSWDGTTNDNMPANIGMYIVYIELFNANKGETKKYKLVCVLSGK